MDFTAAFLNGDLSEEVYMKQPTDFIKEGEHLVCKIKQSLYGLKQSPRCWNHILDKELKKMGFNQSTGDPFIYISKSGRETLIIGVYVDDIILAGRDLKQVDKVKATLAKSFGMKDLGELKYFLGVSVRIDRSTQSVWIGQPSYTVNILKKFGMENARPISTPVDTGTKLTKATESSEPVDQFSQPWVVCYTCPLRPVLTLLMQLTTLPGFVQTLLKNTGLLLSEFFAT